MSIKDAVSRAQAQLKNLLAPSDLVCFVAVTSVGKNGDQLWARDAAGSSLRLVETNEDQAVLATFGWPENARALLGRLTLDVKSQQLVMTPLSIATPTSIIRISC